MTVYLATIHIAIKAESQGEACDAVAEMLRPNVLDWGYAATVKDSHDHPDMPGPFTYPIATSINPDNYEEGDFYAVVPETHKIVASIPPMTLDDIDPNKLALIVEGESDGGYNVVSDDYGKWEVVLKGETVGRNFDNALDAWSWVDDQRKR